MWKNSHLVLAEKSSLAFEMPELESWIIFFLTFYVMKQWKNVEVWLPRFEISKPVKSFLPKLNQGCPEFRNYPHNTIIIVWRPAFQLKLIKLQKIMQFWDLLFLIQLLMKTVIQSINLDNLGFIKTSKGSTILKPVFILETSPIIFIFGSNFQNLIFFS